MAQPEHNLQVQVHKFVRDCVAVPHVFLAFDRSRKQSALQHVREKARGLRAGTADTLLLALPCPPVWVELKAPGNKPSELQLQFASDVEFVGCHWYWAASVEDYRVALFAAGVPLRPNAVIVAAHLDALLASAVMKKSGKAPRSYKPRRAVPTQGALAAAHRSVWRP